MSDEEPKKHTRRKRLLKIMAAVAASAAITAIVILLLVINIFPVMRIYGNTMSSTLFDGDIVIAYKTKSLERGDICIFQINGSIQCKRVVGMSGEEVSIDENGTVYINGAKLDEPYLNSVSLGSSTIMYPAEVPEDSYFVIGDNRRVSIDSRNTAVGFVESGQIKGKLFMRILPTPEILE